MSPTVTFVKRTVVSLMALALLYVVPTLANPNNYPQFAQHQVDPAIPIFFIGVKRVKADLDAGPAARCWWMCVVWENTTPDISPKPGPFRWKCYPGAWPRSRVIFLWSCIEAVHIIWPVWPIRNCIALDIVTCRCSTRACQAGSAPVSSGSAGAPVTAHRGKLGVATSGEWCWCFRLTAYTLIAIFPPAV